MLEFFFKVSIVSFFLLNFVGSFYAVEGPVHCPDYYAEIIHSILANRDLTEYHQKNAEDALQKIESLNAVSVYQSLTQNKKIELTNVRLQQFISNIVSEENGTLFNKPPLKDVYTFDDILEMKLNDKKYIINKVLGQKFFFIENEYPFV